MVRAGHQGGRILGIDPGLAATGFAVVERRGLRLVPLWYDCLRTSAQESATARLVRIDRAVREAIDHFEPQEAAVEELYFGASAPAALAVGQARGVCMLACATSGIEVHEYAPAAIKQSVTGYGRADKQQVTRMVQQILGMAEPPTPDHCADAFAIAICHSGSAALHAASARARAQR